MPKGSPPDEALDASEAAVGIDVRRPWPRGTGAFGTGTAADGAAAEMAPARVSERISVSALGAGQKRSCSHA